MTEIRFLAGWDRDFGKSFTIPRKIRSQCRRIRLILKCFCISLIEKGGEKKSSMKLNVQAADDKDTQMIHERGWSEVPELINF